MRTLLSLSICLVLFRAGAPSFGQSTWSPDAAGPYDLEMQTESLRAEPQPPGEDPARAPAEPAPKAAKADALDADELRARMEKLTWKKGDFKLVPFGVFWSDMLYATQRTNPGAYTLYVYSPEVHGEPAFVIDARRSRFGFDLEGPKVPLFHDAKSYARLEVDFFGSFVTENKGGLLMRHAYWEVKNDEFRFLVGQTRDVVAPLFPSTLSYSVGYYGGNIGYRRMQFRYERYLAHSDTCLVEWQGSLNQNVVTDFSNSSTVVREPTAWPLIEGRLGLVLGPRDRERGPVKLGVSGHIGETGFDFLTTSPPPASLPPADDVRVPTWSFNADMHVPLTDRFGVKGEYFTGSNLSALMGGIGQGVCPATRTAVRSTGGWIDVWYDLAPKLRTNVGWGLDDPNNNDLVHGRTYNQYIFWNALYELTDKLLMGLEIASWKTNYQDRRAGLIPDADLEPRTPGKSVVVQWMVRYAF